MRTTVLYLVAAICFAPAVDAAETALLTAVPIDLDNFQETYDNTPAVSGLTLVGLSVGAFPETMNIGDVRVVPPPSGTSFCVRVTTRDGKFSASNPYVVPPGPAGSIRLSVVTRKFSKSVAGYSPETLAIRAYVADHNCSPQSALHLPQLQPGGDATRLAVLVNSSTRRTIAKLSGPSGVSTSIECKAPADAALIAFDKLCLVERSAAETAGIYELTLQFDDGFGIETFTAQVLLPDTN